MRIRHRVPLRDPQSATLDPDYAHDVEVHTARAEQRYRRALSRLAAAEQRLATAQAREAASRTKAARRELAVATELVELRRQDLLGLAAVMQRIPASAQHRSRDAHRPVPPMSTF